MESSESSEIIALIFDPEMERIAVRSGARSEPPRFAAPRRHYPETPEVLDALRRETGSDCVILRCLDAGDAERGRPRMYSALADADDLRPEFRWAAQSQVRLSDGVSLAEPRDGRPRAQEWQREPGWRREIRAWIADNLPAEFRRAGWSLSQIRSWAISAVFRVESADGARLYFKASPSYFGTEAALAERLAREFPDISPRVVASDAARGWTLTADLGNDTLASAPSADVWRDAMRALARVQLAYADDFAALQSLESLGVERRAPRNAIRTLRAWIADPESAEIRVWHGRFAESLRRLAPNAERLDDMRRRLDALGLPQTLDHGDLDATNIFIQNGRAILMDWSDAAISNPLFTAAMIAPASRDPSLADAYLTHWTRFASLDDLRQAFGISKAIAAIDRAAHYRENIVPYLPDGSAELRDLERYIPDLLDLAARALDKIP